MRKIELLKYNCPLCNADLITRSVDHTHNATNQEVTKTNYRCIGCMEEYYSLEEPYTASPEKSPEYKCPYCNQLCTYMSLKDDWTDYWKCLPCKVSFSQSMMPNWKGIDTINMYTTLKGKLYVLRQFLSDNRSRIEMLPEDEEDTVVIAKEFKFLMPAVTPSNIQTKLLTYLVFS